MPKYQNTFHFDILPSLSQNCTVVLDHASILNFEFRVAAFFDRWDLKWFVFGALLSMWVFYLALVVGSDHEWKDLRCFCIVGIY